MARPDEIRTFAAVDFAPEVVDRADAAIGRLARAVDGVRWVARGNLHLTLHFYGEIAADRVAPLTDALRSAVAGLAAFDIAVAGVGAFPSPARPRVVWLGIRDAAGGLARLHAAVESAGTPLGFAPEDRPFRPHLTVGRVRQGQRARGVESAVDDHADLSCGPTRISELVLYRSDLRPEGPLYTALARLPLAG